jgi:uncharacterized protein (DUF1800 family)
MRGQSLVAAVLCAVLGPFPAAGAGQPAGTDAKRPAYRGQLEGDRRVVHALNRFTFGPRPGDVEAVKAEGLDKWFERQLHPAGIANAGLQARLAEYPAMRLSSDELIARYPSNAVIRQVIEGKAAMPQSGILRTVYENEVARVKAKREEKSQQPATGKFGAKEAKGDGMEGAEASSDAMNAANAMEPARANMQPDAVALQEVIALAPKDRVLRLAAMPQPELDRFLKGLRGLERKALLEGLSPEIRETVGDLEAPERTIAGELLAQRLTRDIYSDAQLQEVMTDFWLNHFNVFLRKNAAMPYLLVSYERDTIRPRALGNFEDLLDAVAHSPAMLLYLDQAESVGPGSMAAVRAHYGQWRNPNKKKRDVGLNENYARELMELHTLGVNGGYTQADVVQAARILTGWTVDRPQHGGAFRFEENRHEPGAKKVMGQKFKDGGEKEGRELLHFLATRPATARFISRKLAVRFVSDDPPQALVERMAKTFESSHGDIAAVLRTMYKSPEFWSEDSYRAKVKTPLEFVVSAARASDADVKEMRPMIEALRQMGMPLYGCVPPTGYKEDAADWVSTGALVSRMNFALTMSAGRLNGVAPAWPDGTATSVEQDEARLEEALVAGGVSDGTRNAVLEQFAQQNGNTDGPRMRTVAATARQRQEALLAGLLLGSPEFQRR